MDTYKISSFGKTYAFDADFSAPVPRAVVVKDPAGCYWVARREGCDLFAGKYAKGAETPNMRSVAVMARELAHEPHNFRSLWK